LSPGGAPSGPAAVTPGASGTDPAAAAAAAAGAAGSPGSTAPPVTGTPGAGAATCGRFVPAICQAYTEAATTGRASPATTELLRRSSPASVAANITAPTLLVQGQQDTLFGLDQSDATARQIAAAGAPVRVVWFTGGHDGGAPSPAVRNEIGAWFDYHLAHRGADPGTGFSYAVQGGVRANASTPTERTVTADAYPGLAGNPVARQSLALQGGPQPVLNPPGGNPAAITIVPGVGGALGALAGRLSAVAAELPGQSATFTSDPVGTQVLIAGSAQIGVTVARVPGQPAASEAVLFGKIYELDPEGRRTLLGSAVAPFRVAVPTSGAATATVTLPGVVAPIEAGNRIVVSISTTDQAYAGSTQPAVWQVGQVPASTGGPGSVAVPVVPGRTVTSNTVPLGQVVGIGLILLVVLVAVIVGRFVTRRSRAARVEGARHDLPLDIENLAKTYPGGVTAVDGVSFQVVRGQVLGLLGPNGAGKTTVLRMLMGLIHPTAGGIRVFGHLAGPGAPVLSRVGSFVEGPGFLPHLSGADNLRLYWAATGRPAGDAHLDEALEIAGLGDAIKRRVRTYSHGMRQRLAIAQAMLGLPELLVLDEPTNGLDPPQIHAMREVLHNYAAAGRTVLLSSHLLAEVEQTCSHVVVMHHGKVVAAGPVAEIVAGGGHASFTVDDPSRAAVVLRSANGVRGVEIADGLVHADLNGMPRASAVDALVRAGVAVEAAGPRRRLEDAFLQLVGEEAR
ncbi:MAG: Sulfate-transporting ATPase, partial [Pseudonocardia sp.]|nr:Sulfate-transporting ATPase [Pseudonocardia sp.]